MKRQLIEKLCCPVCGAEVVCDTNVRSLSCEGKRRHCFDFARSGYLNLSLSHVGGGDDREMVRARTAFLSAGYYQCISDGVIRTLDRYLPAGGYVLDAGCGEGYYSYRMLQAGYDVIGLDLSKSAVDHAARSARMLMVNREQDGSLPEAVFTVAGLFEMPIKDESLDAVVSIFAPIAEEEFRRVLKPGGILVVVGAGRDHLMGLKTLLYDTTYQNQPRADLPLELMQISRETLREEIVVQGNAQLRALFSMTPYYWRTAEADREKLDGVDVLHTPVEVELLTYRKDLA